MRIVDLSHPIEPGMPLWPGTPEPELEDIHTVSRDGFAESLFRFSSHTGTHIDAPAHMIEGADTLDRLAVDRFFGKAMLVDLRNTQGGLIDSGMLEAYASRIAEADFLLLHTGWSRFWGTDRYDEGFPVLSADAASMVAASGLKGIGIDAPSFDAAQNHDCPVHRRLLGSGMMLIENLTGLHRLEHGLFILSVLPLPVTGAEACPVRAVAILSEYCQL